MPKVIKKSFFGGAERKIERLNLGSLLNEITIALESFPLRILEAPNANSGGAIRKLIDAQLAVKTWTKITCGGIDWTKCVNIQGTRVCIGVEVQVSGRSELIYRDLAHFRASLINGDIDVAVEIVPTDKLAAFLTERVLSYSYAQQIIEETRSDDLPIVLIAFEHDGASDIALPKMKTNLGKRI